MSSSTALREAIEPILRRLGLLHLANAAWNLIREFVVWARHAVGAWAAHRYRNQSGLRLNLGCGPNRWKGWVNVDWGSGADLRLDLRRRLPFATGSCEEIYCEHFFEHLDFPDDARHFVGEALRVLKNGGRLRLGVPDAEKMLKQYVAWRDSGSTRGFEHIDEFHPQWVRTPMDHVNFLFRQNFSWSRPEHRYAYDEENLIGLLQSAGFVRVTRRPFQPETDSARHQEGTLYVDAYRP